jgi:hypothetical protein
MAENEDRLANLQGQDPETLNPVSEQEARALAEACAAEDARAATRGEVAQLRDENHIVLCCLREARAAQEKRLLALEGMCRALIIEIASGGAGRRAA